MIVVFGATGNIGFRLVHLLAEQATRDVDSVRVRAFIRDPSKWKTLGGCDGVEVFHGDMGNADDVARALRGATKVFLLSSGTPDLVELQTGVIGAAKTAGIEHLVRVSTAGSGLELVSLTRWHGEIDRVLETSGVPYTILAPNFFMQNLMQYESLWIEHALFTTSAEGAISLVDARDVADVAARILLDGCKEQQLLLSGPEAFSFPAITQVLSRVLDVPIRHEVVTPEVARQYILRNGTPAWMAEDVLNMYEIFKTGIASTLTGEVERIAGRPPTTLDRFARDHRARLLGEGATVTAATFAEASAP